MNAGQGGAMKYSATLLNTVHTFRAIRATIWGRHSPRCTKRALACSGVRHEKAPLEAPARRRTRRHRVGLARGQLRPRDRAHADEPLCADEPRRNRQAPADLSERRRVPQLPLLEI